MKELVGTIANGINNIFSVSTAEGFLECRIKGKVLKGVSDGYNPLAVGDVVRVLPEKGGTGKGLLLSRENRKNALVRWNKKRRAEQTLAANLDLLLAVASPFSPPFRPRFLDRLLLACDAAKIAAGICLNKTDQGTDEGIEERLAWYEKEGRLVLRVSALNGEGFAVLKQAIRGKRTAFIGQSGVGKTSILSRLLPDLPLRIGRLSEKYNRGCHTTVLAHLEAWEEGELIDTPGVREFEPAGIPSSELRLYFREFDAYSGACGYSACTHVHEPDCAVCRAVEDEKILFDRYESYVRLFTDLRTREKKRHE